MAQTMVALARSPVLPDSARALPVTPVILLLLHISSLALQPFPHGAKTLLHPGVPESQSGKVRGQWDCLSCQPPVHASSLVNASWSCSLVTPALRGPSSSSTRSPWKTSIPYAQVSSRTPGRAQRLPSAHSAPPPFTTSSHR